MCGIAGVLEKGSPDRPAQTGADLLTMAACLQHRGADSAGFAVFGSPKTLPSIQVNMPCGSQLPEPQEIYALAEASLSDLTPIRAGFAANVVNIALGSFEFGALIQRIEQKLPGATVIAAGHSLQIQKTVGRAETLTPAVHGMVGSHGVAHLRLATESRIDPAHAQPFWGRPFADIAVTHNGHITNYHKLRQRFEARGFSFASKNDSEIIGVYLGEKMSLGATLKQALDSAVVDLDGSFSFIVATANGLGVARDAFATKPLLYAETDNKLALASEPQALYRLMGEESNVLEIQPKETRTWEIA